MRDADVRAALHARLTHAHRHENQTTRIIDELAIAGQVRIDTAVLNGKFAGYEIKSASDNLKRLPKQVELYSAVLDQATLVVAEKHTEKAAPLLPNWWGIIEVRTRRDGTLRLTQTRRPSRNPEIDPLTLCTLLWREEALNELSRRGLDQGIRSKPKRIIWDRLAEETPRSDLVNLVRETLKARSNWRPATP